MTTTEQADSRVTLCPDGKYRWVYEVPMLKNPSILIDVYKVLGISFGIVWLFNVLIIGCEDGYTLESFWGITSGFLVLMGVFLVIGYVAYVIVAWTYGWKYVVLFTLDEAKLLLQNAFINEVIDKMQLIPLRDRLHYLVEKRFRGELNKCDGCRLCK